MSPSPSVNGHGHGHRIILANPFSVHDNDDDENSSVESTNPPLTPVARQLNPRLPRHALFHVHILIHQIANIPLVSGEFCVQWKFKNVYTPSRSKTGAGGLLSGIVRSRRKETVQDEMGDESASAVQHLQNTSSSSASTTSSSSSSSSSSASSASRAPSSTAPSRSNTMNSDRLNLSATPGAASATTPARGQTAFLRLKEHGVVWEHTLSLLVRMDIDRDPHSNLLLPSPLKLDILQRDTSNPKRDGSGNIQAMRFGVVHLDLAQYACKGEVMRRYLLRESKTNATLKLTTNVMHIPTTANSPSSSPYAGGPPTPTGSSFAPTFSSLGPPTPRNQSFSNLQQAPSPTAVQLPFTAPPLPPGEILAGVANISALGLGGERDVYRTRPKGLDLYGPYYDAEEMEMDLLGKKGRRRRGSSAAGVGQNQKGRGKGGKGDEREGEEEGEKPSFDPSRLPLAYGAKTTEMLIEALFNPVETREKRRESPFTVYVPPGEREKGGPGTLVIETPTVMVTVPSPGTTTPTTRKAKPSPPLMKRTETGMSTRTVKSPGTSGKGSNPSAGIGAGLGIMGLGMGLGVGMGVGVGIVNAGGSDGDGVEHDEKEKESEVGGESGRGGGGGGRLKGWWMKRQGGLSRPGTPGS